MIVGGQTEARAQLSSTIIDYHEPFDQGLKIEKLSRIIGTSPILEMARAYVSVPDSPTKLNPVRCKFI